MRQVPKRNTGGKRLERSNKVHAISLILAFLALVSTIPAYAHADPSAGRILTIDDIGCHHNEQVTALTGLHIASFTNVSATAFASISLASLQSNFDVLYIHTLELDFAGCVNILTALNSRAGDILTWFSSGHRGIVAENEMWFFSGPFATPVPFGWLPSPPTIAHQVQGAVGNTATIVSPGNPITVFLTSADLSGWGFSFHCQFSSSKGYRTLVTGTNSSSTTLPITIDRVAKASRAVVTCQDPTIHFAEGLPGAIPAARLLDNMLVWAASA